MDLDAILLELREFKARMQPMLEEWEAAHPKPEAEPAPAPAPEAKEPAPAA